MHLTIRPYICWSENSCRSVRNLTTQGDFLVIKTVKFERGMLQLPQELRDCFVDLDLLSCQDGPQYEYKRMKYYPIADVIVLLVTAVAVAVAVSKRGGRLTCRWTRLAFWTL